MMTGGIISLIVNRKIRTNESCPCGSGKKHGECCKNKQIEVGNASKKPLEVQVMEMMRKSMKSCCLHPDQGHCKGKIKKAHALQNNKIISLLGGADRHVYIMDAKRQPLLIPLDNGEMEVIVELSKTSVNDATTETCFCDFHDNIVFSAIEKGAPDFDETNEEMKFIYAYKAFIFEYYKQWTAMDIFRASYAKCPPAFNTPMMIGMYRMLQLKIQEFEPIKSFFDKEILAKTHEGIVTCVVKFSEQLNFANYAYIAPDFDLNGKKIKHTINGIMHRLAITVIPEKSQSYIILSCLKSEQYIYEKLFNQLSTSSADKLKYYFSIILPLYSENIVINPCLWESWDEMTQSAYTVYTNTKGPDAVIYSRCMQMGLKNAAKNNTHFDYSNRVKIDLFK